MKILISILFNALILFALAFFLSGNEALEQGIIIKGGITTYLIGGTLLGIINITIKPLLKILSFPLFFVFFGLVSVVINGVVLYLLDYTLNKVLKIPNVSYKFGGEQFSIEWWTNFIIAVAIFSILNMLYSLLFNKK